MHNERYELLSVEEMRRKYMLTADERPTVSLNAERVPEGLRHLIPVAEFWGVSDDIMRDDLVRRAPREAIDNLKRIIEAHEDLLDGWLAGPEALRREQSDEYLAFSAMRMAADFAD